MSQKLTVAIVGCGEFARFFVPLFKAHPLVEKVYVCDLLPRRAREYAEKFGVETISTFEEVLKNPSVNAIANFTQRHLHGQIVLSALRAGKHVYSAVPMASRVEECQEIVDTVKATGLTYMMGETCIYYPSSMFCREHYLSGDFGHFTYGESQYYHDITHFPADYRSDPASSGLPPFFYPTHSTAMLLHAVDSYVTKVTAMGYEDQEADGYFRKDANPWGNGFSNGYSLMKLANGGVGRINECRRLAFKAPSSCVSGFYGTRGSYQFMNARHLCYHLTQSGVDVEDVSDYVNPAAMTEHRADEDYALRVANHTWQWDAFAPIQYAQRDRLPESFRGLGNGHMASHQLLVDDFCTAAFYGCLPTVHAWLAARYTIPGLMAHESMVRDSETLSVPDCGMPE